MSSGRKVTQDDYQIIKATLAVLVHKLKRSKLKAMYQYLCLDSAMVGLYDFEHAYIVGDYLVLYELGRHWWMPPEALFLFEALVVRLAVSGDTLFADVPAFLERKALEAGAKLVVTGTALAKADAALASLYMRSGFQPAAITLTKEPSWVD